MSVPDYYAWHTSGDVLYHRVSMLPHFNDFRITWNLRNSLSDGYWSEKRLWCGILRFADANWDLIAYFHQNIELSQFGMNVYRVTVNSDAVLHCSCEISFICLRGSSEYEMKKIFSQFIYGSAGCYHVVTDFFSKIELDSFYKNGKKIVCRVRIKNLSVKDAFSQTETTYPSKGNDVESFTKMHLPKNEEKELPRVKLDCKVFHDFKNLLLSGEDTDVIIQAKDKQFKAHRLILGARSPVFAAMFRHDTKERATGIVDVEDCEPSAFPVLLEYLYCGSTESLSPENVFGLYTTADKYDVQELKTECLQFIKNNLTVETFCETVRLYLKHSESNLLKLTIDFFSINMKEIVITAKWQAFILENPIQGNEILVKALASCNITFSASEKEIP